MHDPRDLRQLVRDEITEQLASGRELGRLREEAEGWLAATPGADDWRRFKELYEQFATTLRDESAVEPEPSDIHAIERSLSPAAAAVDPRDLDAEVRSAVESVLSAFDRGLSSAEMLDWLATQFGGYHWVHAINNTAVISAALLWGGGDPAVTIGLAVAAGWDTDSCGATAGSLAGAMCGTAGLPSALIEPLEDRLDTAVFGMGTVRISELAKRTLEIALAPAPVDLA